MSEEYNIIRNPLRDQELLNEIKHQFNLSCDIDYIFNRLCYFTDRSESYSQKDLDQLISGLDDKSLLYIKSFFLKLLLVRHPRYKNIVSLYSTTILSYIVPEDDFQIIQNPQNAFYSKHFIEKQQRYDLKQVYSLVEKDAGIKYLPQDIRDKIQDGVVIDGGGYNAETALVFSDYNPKMVYTFDFVKKHIDMMKHKIDSCNKQDIIKIVKYGLGDIESSFSIKTNTSGEGVTLVGLTANDVAKSNSYLAHVTTLDKFVEHNNIDKISLIKLDIEGFEQKAIKGMINIIKKDKPILLFSIYHSVYDFMHIKVMLEDLNLGYKFKIRHMEPAFSSDYYGYMPASLLHPWDYMLFAY